MKDPVHIPDIPSPETVDMIFISHAHMDHIAKLAPVIALCKNARVYMSEDTLFFTRFQLSSTIGSYIGADTRVLQTYNNIMTELVLNRVETVEYHREYSERSPRGIPYRFCIFDAGHVPGSAMLYLKIGEFSVFFASDFCKKQTALTCPADFPKNLFPDCLILCGVHAAKKDYTVWSDPQASAIRNLAKFRMKSNRIAIHSSQLTKSLELLSLLSENIELGDWPISDVYINSELLSLCAAYKQRNPLFSLPKQSYPIESLDLRRIREDRPTIIFDKEGSGLNHSSFEQFVPRYTLHADYLDLKWAIEALKPGAVFLTHVSHNGGAFDEPLTREKFNFKTSVTYTEDGFTYSI